MYLRFGLSCLILLVCLSCTALARNNGPRHLVQRHHRRRAVTLSEFLTPPPAPNQRNPHFRNGKILNSYASPAPQSPGFFSRLMGWINPFGGSPSPPPPPSPTPTHNPPDHQPAVRPPENYGPPNQPQFNPDLYDQKSNVPSRQISHSQFPSISDKSCNPCNNAPWIPLLNGIKIANRHTGGAPGIKVDQNHQNFEIPSNLHIPSPSHEVKIPDFAWGHNANPYNPDYPSSVTGPIPFPHLYSGAMPPLFKATAWDSTPQSSGNIANFRKGQSTGEFTQQKAQLSSTQEQQFSGDFSINGMSSKSPPDYVDVLPPGAETVSGSDNYSSDLHQSSEHEAAPASLDPVVDTLQKIPNNLKTSKQNNYGTRLSSDGQHIIHVEQSPVIDLSVDDNDSKDSSVSGIAEEAPVILKNFDDTYEINTTWSNPSPSTEFYQENSQDYVTEVPSRNPFQGISNRNLTSLLVDVLKNSDDTSQYVDRSTTTQRPYGNYQDLIPPEVTEKIQTTEEPLLEALLKSYENFKKEMEEQERNESKFDFKDIQPGSGFSSSVTARKIKEGGNNEQGGKRSKQVQIIIPYTSQYTPSPFHPAPGNLRETGRIQPRKVPVSSVRDNSKESEEATEEEIAHILQTLESLPKLKKIAKPFSTTKTNTSIDPVRLQKNIDNWTIQEYSRGTTVSTELPSPSHPQLKQSKKIPDEYLTTTEPISSPETIKEAEKSFGNILAGFSFNDLDHDVSASSRIEIPHVRISTVEKVTKPSSSSASSSSEDVSWEQLPVSISPLNKERVYIVTPQPTPKSSKFNVNTTNHKMEINDNSTLQFESIERAYQVLPEAVNNLAVASTGPATLPLWGIMEHEDYASINTTTISPETPILYSGHSRVSHTGQ